MPCTSRRSRVGGFERLEDRALLAAFTVNSLLDTVDANPGDGVALDSAGQTSLRAAIMEANARAGDDTVVLGPSTYMLSIAGADENGASSGDLDVAANGRLTITGAGATNTVIDGADLDRVFHVLAFASLSVSGLTIRNGSAAGDGGGILNAGTLAVSNSIVVDNTAARGGGVANVGTFAIDKSTIVDNFADGGAFFNSGGTGAITNTTISDNTANPEVDGTGGVFNATGSLAITNSTISGNAAGSAGGIRNGGGLTLKHSTVADNTATQFDGAAAERSGGIVSAATGVLTVQNSIVAGNHIDGIGSPDFSGTAASLGNNLIGDSNGSGGWVASDIKDVDPHLGPLANNGGPTQTHALLAGSPAIDAGNNADSPATDQRGAPFVRVFNGTVDIGAYERQQLAFIVGTSTDENDGDYSAGDLSLREALLLTNSNPGHDAITGGTTLSLGELVITDDVSLSAMGLSGGDMFRVLHIVAGVSADITGATIRDGRAVEGGAICNEGNLTISDSELSDNMAVVGGAIFNRGSLAISNSSISNNEATDGINGQGGAIANFGQLTLDGVWLSDNTAAKLGGGIYNAETGSLSLVDSTVATNVATGFVLGIRGGGFYNLGTATVTRSTIAGNTASPEGSSGGGIYNAAGTLAITNSTISGNSANQTGGIFNNAELTITHSTITANSTNMFVGPPSEGSGGIANSASATVTVQNTIVAGNVAGTAGGTPDFFGMANSLGNNLIGNTAGSSGWMASDVQDADPELGPLADNGGSTLTHALLPGSPAIDTGNNAGAPATDQRGEPFARVANGTVDIGAYETQPLKFVVDIAIDENDGNYDPGDLSLREAIVLTSDNPDHDIVEFSPALAGATIILTMGELLITSDLTITGLGTDELIVSGNDASRIFQIAANATVAISDLTIRNGQSLEGGGILNLGELALNRTRVVNNRTPLMLPVGGQQGGAIKNTGSLMITYSTISDNTVTGGPGTNAEGGGIWNGGELTIHNSTIANNSLYGTGGGIYTSDEGTTTIVECAITGNSQRFAGFGGAIWSAGTLSIRSSTVSANYSDGRGAITNFGDLTVESTAVSRNYGAGIWNEGDLTAHDSTISRNFGTAASSGGGIYNSISGNTTVWRTTISDNVSALIGGGGGIHNLGAMSINDSTISFNAAGGGILFGGGVYNRSGTIVINNSTISGNSAYSGGGVYNNAEMSITNCTISNNFTTTGGGHNSGDPGGVGNSDLGTLTIQNTIVAGNRVGFGIHGGGPDVTGGFNSLGNNLIGMVFGSTGWMASDLTGTTASPLDARLGALADNGGPTLTHALLDGSPAIDMANGSASPTADQRGVERPKDGNSEGTAVADIGAFELAHGGEVAAVQGTSGNDTFLVRRNTSGSALEVFANDPGVGMPLFEAPLDSITSLMIRASAGEDRVIVDLVNGNPIPSGSIHFDGAEAGDTDSLVIRGDMAAAEYLPGRTRFGGVVRIGDGEVFVSEVESIDVSHFNSFKVVTPNSRDELFLGSVNTGVSLLRGAANLGDDEIIFSDVGTFVIDAATNDAALSNDDSLTVSGVIPGESGFIEFHSGLGINTLTVRSATARIDATANSRGTLNTTVSASGHLIAHRLRQSSLTMDPSSQVTILPDGTDTATSVLNSLTFQAGGILDINDNALIIDYTGDSPIAMVGSKILEGRGGLGIGNGKWTGTGITSSIAQEVNATMPEARSVGYAENGTLPLGPYTTFRGQPVDATSILIAYTRTGDVNLDGVVNDDDVTILGAMYAPGVPQPYWALGDLDYNGFVDDDDITLLGAFYDPSAVPLVDLVPLASPVQLARRAPEQLSSSADESLIDLLAQAVANEVASRDRVRPLIWPEK